MRYLFRVVFISLFLVVHSFATPKYAKEISLLSATFLYNFDTEQLKTTLISYLKENQNIKALEIFDSISEENVFRFYRLDNKFVLDKDIPKEIKSDSRIKKENTKIIYEGEIIGYLNVYYKNKPVINLTHKEKIWLQNNPIIKIAVMDYWKHDKNGNSFDSDVLKLIAEYGDINIVPVKYKVWAKGFNDAKKGTYVQGIMNLTWSRERAKYFIYTNNYNYKPNFLVVREHNTNIKSLKDLKNKFIYVKTNSINNDIVKDEVPLAKIINLQTEEQLYKNLSSNYKVSAMLTYDDNKKLLKKYHLKIVKVIYHKYSDISIGINKNYPYLASIIDKIYEIIPKNEIYKLRNKKYEGFNTKLQFTSKEKKWLKKKQIITYVYDPDWAPFEWRNQIDLHTGIIADILKLISKESGIKFKSIPTASWAESVNLAKTGNADMYSAVIVTKDREKYMNFTKNNIYEYPAVFVTQNSDKSIYTNLLKDLSDKKIGIVKDNALGNFLRNKYPQFDYIDVKSTKDGFKKLEEGKIDLFGVNFITAQYYITRKGYKDLKIATKIDFTFKLKIAVSKSLPNVVISIIDKSLGEISPIQKANIFDKWTRLKVKKETDWKLLFKIGVVVFIVILFVMFNNYKLKKMVQEKTKNLQELTDSLEETVKERTKEYKKQLRISKMAERKQDELLKIVETSKKEIEVIHKHTRDSIEYAALIQGALIPEKGTMKPYFNDCFVSWKPKDTVGGDIWLFNELRHKDECLLFVVDCTGHGVPGAFVTMIVKAIEREIVAKLKKHPEFDISPSKIMAYFNNTMKKLLHQETTDSVSNAGFDGGIIYYNRREQILKFSGAETSLFYIDTNGELSIIKGDRYSVGYKKCKMDYEYKENIIKVEEGMKFFCTTDGYLDQNGGKKGFPFGKKRFKSIIQNNYTKPMQEIEDIFIEEITKWKNTIPNNEQNDDMTVVGFEIGQKSNEKEVVIDEIFQYEGVITQNVIATAMDNIESKISNMSLIGNISTITIEYCQNMMNYSKNKDVGSRQIVPAGKIEIQYYENECYVIISQNIISMDDKNKIEPKLEEISLLDKAGIKKRYRELRKSGVNTHEKGGGIGLYEIAKVSDNIEYSFKAINEDKFYFTMKSIVNEKKKIS